MRAEYRAREVYESTRGMVAFNLPSDAWPYGANQHGKRYTFPDGSYLRIDRRGNQIEWRERTPRDGYGAIRVLFNLPQCVMAMRCYCAGHARGNPNSAPCDTTE